MERITKKENINKQNIPELRFSEFNGEWNETKLGQISSIHDGTHGTHQNVEKGKYLLSAENIENGKVIIRKEPRIISEEDFNKIHKKYFIENGDLLLTIVGSIGRTAIVENYNKEYTFQRSVAIINSEINSYFLNYYIQSHKVQKELKIRTNSSAQGGIYLKELSKIKINCPSDNEQQKIASLFLALDQKIEFMEKNHQYFQEFKKYLLQNIFAQKLRFENHLDKWETYKLKELCDIVKGKQLNKDNMIDNGTYYVLNGGINPSGFTNDWNTPENTISISEGGNSCGYVNFNTKKFWSGGHCYTLDLSSNSNLNVYFLYSYLKSIESGIMRLRVGSGLPNIQKRDIESIRIKIPSNIEEQNKIANLLFSTDQKIKLVTDQLSYMEDFKKGLLQSLFV